MLIGQQTLFAYSQGDCNVTCIVTGGKWKQNTYIVSQVSSSNTIIVDPGGSSELIIKHIDDAGGKVTHILLTHPHHDHVGAVAQVSERFDVACELHAQDVRLLKHAPMYALSFAKKEIAAVSRFQPFEELSLVKPVLRSLHTPGHTKGSVCYVFDGFAFTGDTLLYQRVGRTDLPGSSSADLFQSIEQILTDLTDETVLFSGHGNPWTVGEAKQWWQEQRDKPPADTSFIDD